MGTGQSSEDEVGGFRVFKVTPGSPAAEAGLEVFFDFVVAVNGSRMSSDQAAFFEAIQECENKAAHLVVYNIRTQKSRDVVVMPRRWAGTGLLGAVVRYDVLGNAECQGIRVLEVFAGSPAEDAGLVAREDYLLGTAEVMFRDLEELVETVTLCQGKRIQVYVYSSESETIREVTMRPRADWGGDGCIGADIRTGLLHRIPLPCKPAGGPLQAGAEGPREPEAPRALAGPTASEARPSLPRLLCNPAASQERGKQVAAAASAGRAASPEPAPTEPSPSAPAPPPSVVAGGGAQAPHLAGRRPTQEAPLVPEAAEEAKSDGGLNLMDVAQTPDMTSEFAPGVIYEIRVN